MDLNTKQCVPQTGVVPEHNTVLATDRVGTRVGPKHNTTLVTDRAGTGLGPKQKTVLAHRQGWDRAWT